MSLYADYIKERENKQIIEDECGFATYLYLGDICYIVDIYVKPEFRQQGLATKYADAITILAKEKGIKKLLGSVCLSTTGSTTSIKTLLAYGFKLSHLKELEGMIYLTKEIL